MSKRIRPCSASTSSAFDSWAAISRIGSADVAVPVATSCPGSGRSLGRGLLGHAKIASTARYAHLDDGHVLEAAERTGIVIAAAMGDSGVLPYNTMCDSGKLIQ